MPRSFSATFPYKLLFSLCLLLSGNLYSQGLTGLWTGNLRNDSATARKDQLFEIVLTEYKGKVYGYSRNEFIVNDTLYYILKKVKGTIIGSVCEVVDDEILSNNFQGRLDKGVKVTTTFRKRKADSTWYLDGTWKTNATKKYYSVGGKTILEQEYDLSASRIFPHLEEMKLADQVAFYRDRREEPNRQARLVKSERVKTEENRALSLLAETQTTPIGKRIIEADSTLAKTIRISTPFPADTVNATRASALVKPAPTSPNQPVSRPETPTPPGDGWVLDPNTGDWKQEQKNPVAKTVTSVATPGDTMTKRDEGVAIQVQQGRFVLPTSHPLVVAALTKVDFISGRRSQFTQEILFHSDSLELALYDNGEIDGDTVTVFLNGEAIMTRQGLKSSAIRKTIAAPPSEGVFTLVMFAESLGRHPPNTGLLVVRDGEESYQVRFSSDFRQSTGILFKRVLKAADE